jgi:hypothetical protein
MVTIVGRDRLRWRKSGNVFALHFGQQHKALLHVVPDAKYPDMWRVKHSDSTLSDMVNLSRAKDAAVSIALARINKVQETSSGAVLGR